MDLRQSRQEEIDLDWYKPGKSLKEFHESAAKTRGVVGGRGSGKTTTVATEAIRHALHNPGAKILGLRKTEISQTDTTVDTFNQVYGYLGELYIQTPTSLFKSWRGGLTVRLPSLLAIEKYNQFLATNPGKRDIQAWLETDANRWCTFLEFRGVPDASKTQNKLRGYECSMALLIEADLLEREDYNLMVPCLRWKNAFGKFIEDTCIIIDTNPPSPKHWIAELEKETKGNPKFEFWHIPTAENSNNLPPGYVEDLKETYKRNPAMYDRMVLGLYAEAFDGNPVLYSFDIKEHAHEDLPFPQGAYLLRGWDFGVKNCTIFSAYWEFEGDEYWWDLCEYYAEDSDTDRQAKKVMEITALSFPFWNDRSICSGVKDYCDPAGANRKSTGGTDLDVLASYGIYPGYKTKERTLSKTVAIYNRLLQKKDKFGRFIYRIDKKFCPMLYTASIGGYRYPKVGEAGYGKNDPLKDGTYDHIADAARYPKINMLRLARMDEAQNNSPSVGRLLTKVNINPAKRYR